MTTLEEYRDRFFRYADQRDRAAAVWQTPIYARGFRFIPELTGDGDEFRGISTRTLTERAAEARLRAAIGIGGRVAYVCQIEGPVPAIDRSHKVASDWAYALRDAGLVDAEPVGNGRYSVTPRDATPSHEYDMSLTPGKVRPAATMTADRSGIAPRLASHEWETLASGDAPLPAANVPIDVMLTSAADPQRWHPSTSRLDHLTTTFLHEHGESWPAPDVFDRKRRRYHVRPDRVSFKGTPRYIGPAPVQYEHGYREASDERGRAIIVPSLAKVAKGADGQHALRTRETWQSYCDAENCGCAKRAAQVSRTIARDRREHARRADYRFAHEQELATVSLVKREAAARRIIGKLRTRCTCVASGWTGHTRTTFAKTVRAERAAARASRATVATRGPNVDAFAMSARSLRVATQGLTEHVARLVDTFAALASGETVAMSDGVTVHVIGRGKVLVSGASDEDMLYSLLEGSRRLALARLTVG